MPDQHQPQPPDHSHVPLERPAFKSQIPSHLLADASEAEKHIIEQLSILVQFAEWSTRTHLIQDHYLGHINARIYKVESDLAELREERSRWTHSGKILIAVAGGIAGIVSTLWAVYKALSASQ